MVALRSETAEAATTYKVGQREEAGLVGPRSLAHTTEARGPCWVGAVGGEARVQVDMLREAKGEVKKCLGHLSLPSPSSLLIMLPTDQTPPEAL